MIFHGVGGNCGRALGYAVAVENLYTEVIETLLILGVKRSTADNDILQISAELLMNLSEQLAADVDAELEKEAAYLDALLEDFLSAGLSRGLPDALIDSLDNQRNAGEVLRMMGLEILNEVLYIYADIAVGDDDKRGEDSRNPREGMVKRQEADGVSALEAHAGGGDNRSEVAVSEHNALALAGGAGGENDGCEIIGRYDDILILGVAVRKELLALIDVLLEIGDIEICIHGSTYLFYLLDCRSIVLGIEDSLALALVELNGKILCGKLGVKRNADYLSEKVRKKCDYPLIGVLADNGNIAVLDAVGKHICAKAVDIVPNVVKCFGDERIVLCAVHVVIHKEGLILSLADAVDDKLLYRLDIGHIIVYVLVLLFHFFDSFPHILFSLALNSVPLTEFSQNIILYDCRAFFFTITKLINICISLEKVYNLY